MTTTVLILGANGRFGRVAAEAFANAGWEVIAQARHPRGNPSRPGVTMLGVPVTDTAAIAGAAGGAGVVVNAMNPLYTRWNTEAPPLNDAAIAIARALDATLMLPGNVYNFGAPMPALLTEDTPEKPVNAKGRIRSAMESGMRARAPRSIVVRAGDFFGGSGTGSWMDLAILKDLARGRITYPGPRNVDHAWAYLPDLAQVFVRLAAARDRVGDHERFHFPGYTLTGDALVAAITRVARGAGLVDAYRDPVVRGMPWPLLRVAGLVNPMLREIARMQYLWQEPHRMSGDKLAAAIGPVPITPLDTALASAFAALNLRPPHPSAAMADIV